jgi:hypothetical protein
MAILLSNLLSRVPEATYDRVDHTRRRIGNHIREAMRRETGLFLIRPDGSTFANAS